MCQKARWKTDISAALSSQPSAEPEWEGSFFFPLDIQGE